MDLGSKDFWRVAFGFPLAFVLVGLAVLSWSIRVAIGCLEFLLLPSHDAD